MLSPPIDRWTYLVRDKAHNYGVNGASLTHIYPNLAYILKHLYPSARCIYVMPSVNDLMEFLNAPDYKRVGEPWNFLWPEVALIRQHSVLWRSRLLRYAASVKHGMDPYRLRKLIDGLEYRKILPPPTEQELSNLYQRMHDDLFQYRKKILSKINDLAKRHGKSLVWITQPHGFRRHYIRAPHDTRMIGTAFGKRFNPEHLAHTIDMVNEDTRNIVREINGILIDGEKCFDHLEELPLYSDGIHFTPLGNRLFAACIDKLMDREGRWGRIAKNG